MNDLVIDEVNVFTGLSERLRVLIREGQIRTYPSRDPAKPVLRWAADNASGRKPGTLVTGGGVSPRHVDSENGKKGGYKNTNAWLELLERRLDADDGGGFEAVIEGMVNAATGIKKPIEYQCEECDHENTVIITLPPDPRAGKILMEFLVPKPTARTEIDIAMAGVQFKLSELIEMSVDELASHKLTDAEIAERVRLVEEVDTDGGTN